MSNLNTIIKELKFFVDDLNNSKKIHKATSTYFETRIGPSNFELGADKKPLSITYRATIYISFSESDFGRPISTFDHVDPKKCLQELRLRINNEINLNTSLDNLKKDVLENLKLEPINLSPINELDALVADLKKAHDNENFEEANLIKKKIEKLNKLKKRKPSSSNKKKQ